MGVGGMARLGVGGTVADPGISSLESLLPPLEPIKSVVFVATLKCSLRDVG